MTVQKKEKKVDTPQAKSQEKEDEAGSFTLFHFGAATAVAMMLPNAYYSVCLYHEAQAFDPSYPWPRIT
jgi:hypothetical protein